MSTVEETSTQRDRRIVYIGDRGRACPATHSRLDLLSREQRRIKRLKIRPTS